MNKNNLWIGATMISGVSWLYGNTLTNPSASLFFMLILPGIFIVSSLLHSSNLK